MKKDLKQRIKEFNEIKYPNDNSKRIIVAKLTVKSGRVWSVDDSVTKAPNKNK
tara:strand:- start:238 stop:396 length:159 start_codon:yes stop_codon:yes gene_type:complete